MIVMSFWQFSMVILTGVPMQLLNMQKKKAKRFTIILDLRRVEMSIVAGGIGAIMFIVGSIGWYKIQEGFNQIHKDDVHTREHI